MDGFERRTMVIYYRWTEVDGGQTRTVHLMDRFGRLTMKNLKMLTEVDKWTKIRPLRPGLVHYVLSHVTVYDDV